MATRIFQGKAILMERDASVATITLNRPAQLNALNKQLQDELSDCWALLARDAGSKAVVITGAGRAFCAAGDIDFLAQMTPAGLGQYMHHAYERCFKPLWHLEKPTIAAVNGVAAGGGTTLSQLCDIVFASNQARFGYVFGQIGFMPDLGGLFTLTRAAGLHRAKELAFTGELFDAAAAQRYGLVNRVVPHEQLMAETHAFARRLAAGPARAYALAKTLLNRSFESSMEEILQGESAAQPLLAGTADHREGMAAFREKRLPRFA